ncbi:uncharacterized protein C2845_PM15G16640 [Panicum miliaceum]|uniref:Uncharacterized protein n=1 Tax=Panicum miliaceum TaxID=4540 RepID=A0A3L6QAH2_PANMI|nr:uncharacterized protein C2845_PM15G16640 [Panicum miliaceum]
MSESDCGNQTKQFKVSANAGPMDTCEKEVVQTACHKDITESPWDPSDLFIVHDEKVDLEKMDELSRQRTARMAKAVPNEIRIPDPTPDFVGHAFYRISHRLGPVLKKDSVRCFLRLFSESPRAMSWNLNITSETLTCIVSHDALRCAKVVLEGSKMPDTRHANPNCINPHGYFPLHEAAERFSVEMVKLLFRHGASANVRTVGDEVIENLLPLHVAIENTCMHKYLEDNLSPTQYHRDYIYKLIHLLCLPEMKIFLDTIRLLAEKTDNLLDELWNYMKDRKLVQTSLLLLAAQKQIRKHDWFNTIMYRIYKESYSLKLKSGDTGEAQKQLEETFHLVSIISHAGEALDKYIQAHSEVPHVEVLEYVSSVLKDFGLSPKTDYIDVRNLACACKQGAYRNVLSECC